MNESLKKSLPVIVFMVLVIILWIVVYALRQKAIDREISEMTATDTITINNEEPITTVRVKLDGRTYSLKEFTELEEIPETVHVIVYYQDGDIVEKPAYVSYSDNADVEYIDNTYGRIIILGKETENNDS